VPRQSSSRPRVPAPALRLPLLGAFGLGAAIGYAGGRQRSFWGLLALVLLLVTLVALEAWQRRRESAGHGDEAKDQPLLRGSSRPGKAAREQMPDRPTDKQRYLM
jgi:hypothetical protein